MNKDAWVRNGCEMRLWDSQWMRIVNADYSGMSREDAIHAAVKATEEMMAKNCYKDNFPPFDKEDAQ